MVWWLDSTLARLGAVGSELIGSVVVNTFLASASGGIATMFILIILTGKLA